MNQRAILHRRREEIYGPAGDLILEMNRCQIPRCGNCSFGLSCISSESG
jgi:hypothetical protein